MSKRSGFNLRENVAANPSRASSDVRVTGRATCGVERRGGAPLTPRGSALLLFVAATASFGAACSAPVSEGVATTSAAGSTAFPNDQTAYDYFRSKGFTNFQAAGITGNLDQESGIDPTISQQGGGPGRGIAQWSAGGRWDTDQGDNLVAFAAQEGLPTSSLQVQLDFIMYELNTFPDYGLAALKATTNVSDAATSFELGFEGCAIASECDGPSRVSYAMDVLNAYGNDPVETDAGSSEDAGSAADDAGSNDSGTHGGSHDGGAKDSGGAVGIDASAPVGSDDAGGGSKPAADAGGGSSNGGSDDDAGPVVLPSSSGCSMTTARTSEGSSAGLLAGLGFVIAAVRRRRRAQGATASSGK